MSIVPFLAPKIDIMLPTGEEVRVELDLYPGVIEGQRPQAFYFCLNMGELWSDNYYYRLGELDAQKVAKFEEWATSEIRRLTGADVACLCSLVVWIEEMGCTVVVGNVSYRPFFMEKRERLDITLKNLHHDVTPKPRNVTVLKPNHTGFIPMSKMQACLLMMRNGEVVHDRR